MMTTGTCTRVTPSASSPIGASPMAVVPLSASSDPTFSVSRTVPPFQQSTPTTARVSSSRHDVGVDGRHRTLTLQDADDFTRRFHGHPLAGFLRIPRYV